MYFPRWRAIEWPQKIIRQIEEVTAHLVEEEERFQKIQIADQDIFEQRIEAAEVRLAAPFLSRSDGAAPPS